VYGVVEIKESWSKRAGREGEEWGDKGGEEKEVEEGHVYRP